MLPYQCIDSIAFGDEVNVYYSTQTQDARGTIIRTWTLDRIERCMITQSRKIMYGIAEMNTWNDVLIGQAEEDLRIDSDGNLHAPSEVMITFNKPILQETAGPRKGLATTYELKSSSPAEGPFGEVMYFNITLQRSNNQDVTIV